MHWVSIRLAYAAGGVARVFWASDPRRAPYLHSEPGNVGKMNFNQTDEIFGSCAVALEEGAFVQVRLTKTTSIQ